MKEVSQHPIRHTASGAVRQAGPKRTENNPCVLQTAFECTRENPDSSICLMSYIRYDSMDQCLNVTFLRFA